MNKITKYCDICGDAMEDTSSLNLLPKQRAVFEVAIVRGTSSTEPPITNRRYDFCPVCQKRLLDVLDNKA